MFYFEVPNALYTLRDLGIWDLIYEHVSYFTTAFFARSMRGRRIRYPGCGHLVRRTVSLRRGEAECYASDRGALVDGGKITTLVDDFDRSYRDKVAHWRNYLAERDPQMTVIWGGGSKGITFVNTVPGAERIRAIIDVNPHKQGRFAPGTGTPVLSPEALRDMPIQSIIIMNPLYRGEIEASARALGLSADVQVA